MWPASANGLQAPVTEACWLLAAERQFALLISKTNAQKER